MSAAPTPFPWRRALLLAAVLVAGVLSVPLIPTHDGLNHLASCALYNRLGDPDSSLHAFLERSAAISSMGFFLLCRPLDLLFGWALAHQLAFAGMGLLWSFGFLYLARGVTPGGQLGLLGFALAQPWALYMGFYPFVVGSALSLWVLGYAVRAGPEPRRGPWLVLASATAFVTFCHGFAGVVLGAALALWVLLAAAPGRRLVALGKIALAGAPSVLLVLAVSTGASSSEGSAMNEATLWLPLAARLPTAAATFLGGAAARAWIGFFGAVFALGAGLVQLRGPRTTAPQKWAALVGVLGLLGYSVLPFDLASWSFFGPRLLLVPLALAFLGVPASGRLAGRRLVPVAVLLLALASLGWTARYHHQLQVDLKDASAGLEAPLARTGPRLPLFLRREASSFEHAEPLVMAGHLYLLAQGGVSPYLWATIPWQDPTLFRAPPEELFGPHPARFVRESLKCATGELPQCPTLDVQYEWLALFGRRFEDVVLFHDDPAALETFLARGYVADLRAGDLSILSPRACRFAVRLAGAGATRAPLVVEIGRHLQLPPVYRTLVPAGTAIPEEGLALEVDGPDCGALWARVTREAGDSACVEPSPRLGQASPEAPGQVGCTLAD